MSTRRPLRTLLTTGAVLLALATTLGTMLTGSSARAASPSDTLGVYKGAGNPSGVASFSSWLGRPVTYAEDFFPGDSWSSMENPAWVLSCWKGSGYKMVFGIPIIPATGGSLAQGASGAYDSHFATLAKNMVANGEGDAILRPGWEFNGSWFKWAVTSDTDAANFASYFRHIVNAMRSVAPGLKFDWNLAGGAGSVDMTKAYPGDAYVDYIGLDQYDASWIANHTDPAARWSSYLTQAYGLNWQKSFAAAHGKQMSFPEWGLWIRSDGYGGGDNSYFIDQMYNWISQNNFGYTIYFDVNAQDGLHQLEGSNFPIGAAEFKATFGSGSSPTSGGSGSTTSYTVSESLSNGYWTATPSDVANTAKVEFLINGATQWTESYSPYQFNGDSGAPLSLPAGTYSLQVRATSNTGTVALSSPMSYTSGSGGTSSPTAYTVTESISNGYWTAAPSDVANTSKVEFLINGVVKWTELLSPYQYNGDPNGTLSLPDGSYTLQVRATSKSGTVALSGSYAYSSGTSGSGGGGSGSGSTTSYTVTQSFSNGHWIATPSDVANTAKVEFLIDGNVRWTETLSPYQYNGDPDGTLVLPPGRHKLQVRATSKSGTVAQSSVYKM